MVALVAASSMACAAAPKPQPEAPAPTTQALLLRAEEAERAREYLRAQTLYEQAKALAPDPRSRALAGRAYGRALVFYGEHERAAQEFESAVALTPGDAGLWHDLGIVRHHLGDRAGAEAAFRRARAAAPKDGRPRIALAALLMQQGRHRDALGEYRALLQLRLPEPVREKVQWAVGVLERKLAAPGSR